MFAWIAKRAQARAERTGKVRHIKRAWFWRSLAQWLRGGDWSPFAEYERTSRRTQPRAFTVMEGV